MFHHRVHHITQQIPVKVRMSGMKQVCYTLNEGKYEIYKHFFALRTRAGTMGCWLPKVKMEGG